MSKSIWDHSYTNAAGTTIREAYFTSQDENDAITLRDIGGQFLRLEDQSEFTYATAERRGRQWWVTVRDGKSPRYQIFAHKADAIDLILGSE